MIKRRPVFLTARQPIRTVRAGSRQGHGSAEPRSFSVAVGKPRSRAGGPPGTCRMSEESQDGGPGPRAQFARQAAACGRAAPRRTPSDRYGADPLAPDHDRGDGLRVVGAEAGELATGWPALSRICTSAPVRAARSRIGDRSADAQLPPRRPP